MALIPKISLCVNCDSIKVTSTTGWYNAITNPGGFNDDSTVWTNSLLGNPYVIAATLEFYLNDVLFSTVDVTETVQDSVFPEFELYTLTQDIADGVYRVVFKVTEDEDEFTFSGDSTQASWCNVECCVNKLAAKVAEELCNNCDSKAMEDFQFADTLLNSLEKTAQCLGQGEFLKILNKLQKICGQTSSSDCGCGCS